MTRRCTEGRPVYGVSCACHGVTGGRGTAGRLTWLSLPIGSQSDNSILAVYWTRSTDPDADFTFLSDFQTSRVELCIVNDWPRSGARCSVLFAIPIKSQSMLFLFCRHCTSLKINYGHRLLYLQSYREVSAAAYSYISI